MEPRRKTPNPFYVLLVVAGTAFVITACAYGVMAVKQMHASQGGWARYEAAPVDATATPATAHPFLTFLDQHGVRIMLIELVVLAVGTVAAMGTDRWWSGED